MAHKWNSDHRGSQSASLHHMAVPWHRSVRSCVSVETWEDLKSDGGCVTEPDSLASSSCYTGLVTPEIELLLCCYVTTCCRWVSRVSPALITHCPQLLPAPQRGLSCCCCCLSLSVCWSVQVQTETFEISQQILERISMKFCKDIHSSQTNFCDPQTFNATTRLTSVRLSEMSQQLLDQLWLSSDSHESNEWNFICGHYHVKTVICFMTKYLKNWYMTCTLCTSSIPRHLLVAALMEISTSWMPFYSHFSPNATLYRNILDLEIKCGGLKWCKTEHTHCCIHVQPSSSPT